ncbi:DUF2007 domain-containing protein [bacterium]|nr:DUF2007 domain-containing protein [candidate division CSSED10-310 bacterium]
MKKVYETLDPLVLGHFKNLLENENISCMTRNEYLASAAGGLPPTECWYEIWVDNDRQYNDAKKIIETALSDEVPSGPPWICSNCGEENENHFTECWKCGWEKPITT